MKSKHVKLLVFVAIIILLFLLNHRFGWSDYIGDENNLLFLREMVDNNIILTSLIYIVITIIGCVFLALPGITFAILAGLIFNPILGTLLCSLGATIGASGSYLIGKFFLKDSIKPFVEKNKLLKKILFDERGKNQVVVLMITRLVPIFPFNLQNFAYGITDISFSTYTLFTFIFILPGTALFTFGTAGIAEGQGLYLIITLLLVLLLIFVIIYFRKYYNQKT